MQESRIETDIIPVIAIFHAADTGKMHFLSVIAFPWLLISAEIIFMRPKRLSEDDFVEDVSISVSSLATHTSNGRPKDVSKTF